MNDVISSPAGLLHILVWGALLVACVKGKIRWGGFLILLLGAAQLVCVNQILIFANPVAAVVRDAAIHLFYFIPGLVAVVMAGLAGLTLAVGKSDNLPPTKEPSWFRWLFLLGSYAIVVVGHMAFLVNLFADGPHPMRGFVYWTALAMLGCACGYAASRMGSIKRPNLLRWLTLPLILLTHTYTLVFILILLFAYPKPDNISQTVALAAALMSLAYVPPALAVVGLARDYVGVVATEPQE